MLFVSLRLNKTICYRVFSSTTGRLLLKYVGKQSFDARIWNLLISRCLVCRTNYLFLPWRNSPSGPRSPHCQGFTITLRHTTLVMTPLDEWLAWCRDFYLTTNNTHNRQTSMPQAGFEPTFPATERPQTHALDRPAPGIGRTSFTNTKFILHTLLIFQHVEAQPTYLTTNHLKAFW
jgi:hypothetical protein